MDVTVPTMVMILSGLLWFVWDVALPDSPGPIPRFNPWFVQMLRILFAVSAFWVIASAANRSVF